MALTTVEKTILGVLDRFAYQIAASVQACSGGTDVWDRVDAAGDEVFENLVKGQRATDLDTAFGLFPVGEWGVMQEFVGDLQGYLATALGYASFDAWLTAERLRVDLRAARQVIGKQQNALSIASVHAGADAGASAPGTALGDLMKGSTFTAGTDIDASVASPSAILGRVTVIGSADWAVTATLKLWDGTTKSVVQNVLGTGNGGVVGNAYVFGRQALSGGAASGQKVVPVAATGQFKVGQTVLLTEWTGNAPDEVWTAQETAVIEAISANASLTMTENLLHSYTTAGFVYPAYLGVSAATDTGGTAGNRLYFYPAADRRLRL